MYRKEECLSLLKDPEQPEDDDENQDKNEKTPTLKWHKVNFLFIGWSGMLIDEIFTQIKKKKIMLVKSKTNKWITDICIYEGTLGNSRLG